MIIKLARSGKSFVGLGQYLTHDPKADTSKRVVWTQTLNCANDHVPSAIDEMLWTYRDAEFLKQEAGIRPGGSRVEKPVKHLSLNWAMDETPTREEMIEATQAYLKQMGWQEHQALLVAQNDKPYSHVHVMLNAIHPETGLRLDDGLEKRRTQEWALEYEREQGKIYCEERLKPVEEREASPTREAALAFKNSEKEFDKSEAARRNSEADNSSHWENQKTAHSEEWKYLKEFQRSEREDFFAAGKAEFIELRKEIYRETREEFRDQWAEFYAAKRGGHDPAELAERRAEIIAAQKSLLDERRTEACAELRVERDAVYRSILDGQKEMRADLTDRQEQGISSPHLGDLIHHLPERPDAERAVNSDAFRDSAEQLFSRVEQNVDDDRADADDFDYAWLAPAPAGVRPGLDIGGNLGMGLLGGIGVVGESLFDGFFGNNPTPKRDHTERPRMAPPAPEFPRHNPFAAFAEEAQRRAERQQEESDRVWWDERRARYRD